MHRARCRAGYHLPRGAWFRRRPGKGPDGPCRRRGSGEESSLGDGHALSGLYERYSGLIYGTGMRYLGDRGTAEELVQDVFISVWKNAARFDPARASFATWLYRITCNRATDLIRRRNARVRTVTNEPLLDPGEIDLSGVLSRRFDVAVALAPVIPGPRGGARPRLLPRPLAA